MKLKWQITKNRPQHQLLVQVLMTVSHSIQPHLPHQYQRTAYGLIKNFIHLTQYLQGRPQAPENIETPYKKFKRYEMLQLLAKLNQHVLHSKDRPMHQHHHKPHGDDNEHVFFRTGLHKMLGVRCYFEKENKYGPVADIMPRNKMLVGTFYRQEGANDETIKE